MPPKDRFVQGCETAARKLFRSHAPLFLRKVVMQSLGYITKLTEYNAAKYFIFPDEDSRHGVVMLATHEDQSSEAVVQKAMFDFEYGHRVFYHQTRGENSRHRFEWMIRGKQSSPLLLNLGVPNAPRNKNDAISMLEFYGPVHQYFDLHYLPLWGVELSGRDKAGASYNCHRIHSLNGIFDFEEFKQAVDASL